MASIDLIRASNGSGDAVKATVTNARVIGSTTLQVSSITNFPTSFIATVGDVDGTGVFVSATVTVFEGHTSGGDIEIDSYAPGYTDIGNTPDQIVVLKPTTAWANEIADVLAVTHNQDGTLKNKVATLAKLNGGSTDGVLLTDASGNVTGGKVTADKTDSTSYYTYSAVIPYRGLTTTAATAASVTLPGAGRYLVTASLMFNNVGEATVKDYYGNLTLGGTTIRSQYLTNPPSGYAAVLTLNAVVTTTEAKTVGITVRRSGSNGGSLEGISHWSIAQI